MSKKFAVFDIDGTLIRWQLYHAITDALIRAGHFDARAFEPVKQARMVWKKRGHETSYKDYERELVQAFEQAILTVNPKQFMDGVEQAFNEYKEQTYTYTRDLIKQLKTKSYMLFAISGSQKEAIELLAEYYGFDDFGGSVYATSNGSFTGEKHILTKQEKPKALKKLVEKHGCTYADSIAVGDSESDIPILSVVEKPIAFNPDKGLFEHAKRQGWPVVIERKNMVYKLENADGKYSLA